MYQSPSNPLKRLVFVLLALLTLAILRNAIWPVDAHAAGTKLSAIASGGSIASSTDQLVGVRSGTTDVLLTVGSACVENLTSIVVDTGAGGLTLGAGQVTNTMLGNSSMTLAGHVVSLGGTQAFACSDLTGAATSCSTDTTNASNISSGSLANARLPALSANQLLGALTGTTPSGQSVPSC